MPVPRHVAVSAPDEPLPTSRIPSFTSSDAVALAPISKAPEILQVFKDAIDQSSQVRLQLGQDKINDSTKGLIWLDSSSKGRPELEAILDKHKGIAWVQLSMAGINAYSDLIKTHSDKVWTSAKGAFAQPVAEHALMLTLALLRHIPARVRAKSWGPSLGHSLFNSRVLILGSGGITLSLLSLLAPFTPRITVLRRRSIPLAPEVIPAALKDLVDVSTLSSLHSLLPEIDVLVIACALTKETHKVIGQKELQLLPKHAIVVNIARGPHIDTEALVQALRTGEIAGAGLDVTDPEPLPDDSPLWDLESSHEDVAKSGGKANLIITPHTADTQEQVIPLLASRFAHNVKALVDQSGKFEGLVDADAGY